MDDMPAYPANFQRFGRGFAAYDFIIVGWVLAVGILPEFITDWHRDNITLVWVFLGLVLGYLLFHRNDKARGLYAVRLRHVFCRRWACGCCLNCICFPCSWLLSASA